MNKLLLLIALVACSAVTQAQIKLRPNSVGINVLPAAGKTLDVKGANGGQIRLNNAGEASTSLEFSNNDVRKGFIETNTATNEFKIVSEASGQAVKIYTQGIERFSINSDGIVSLPNGIKFGGSTPTSGTLRWTGTALEIYNGAAWQALGGTSDPAQDKRAKTNFYLDNDPY